MMKCYTREDIKNDSMHNRMDEAGNYVAIIMIMTTTMAMTMTTTTLTIMRMMALTLMVMTVNDDKHDS